LAGAAEILDADVGLEPRGVDCQQYDRHFKDGRPTPPCAKERRRRRVVSCAGDGGGDRPPAWWSPGPAFSMRSLISASMSREHSKAQTHERVG